MRSRAACEPSYLCGTARAKLADLRLGILRRENRVARDERIGASLPHRFDRFAVEAAIDLEKRLAAIFREHYARAPNLVDRALDELLSTEAGVDRHHEQQVEIGNYFAHGGEGRRRVDDCAGSAATPTGGGELRVKMRGRCAV